MTTPPRYDHLTPSHWTETFEALDSEAAVRQRIRRESLLQDFTVGDWNEIQAAVESKYSRLRESLYGRDSVAREWRSQMGHIVETVAEIRQALEQ
jgi:hypothetical protein